MDWTQILTVFGASILGSGGVSGAIMWFWQHKLQKQANIELEKFKAIESRISSQLNTKFSIWHTKRVESMAEVYASLAELFPFFYAIINPLQAIPSDPEIAKEYENAKYSAAGEKLNNAIICFSRNKLLFETASINKIEKIIKEFKKILNGRTFKLSKKTHEYSTDVDNAEKLLEELRIEFCDIIEKMN